MPHRRGTLLDPRSDDGSLPWGPDRDNAAGRLARERLAANGILSLARLRIALPLRNVTREDDVLDVEDADFVIVCLIGCVKARGHASRSTAALHPPRCLAINSRTAGTSSTGTSIAVCVVAS